MYFAKSRTPWVTFPTSSGICRSVGPSPQGPSNVGFWATPRFDFPLVAETEPSPVPDDRKPTRFARWIPAWISTLIGSAIRLADRIIVGRSRLARRSPSRHGEVEATLPDDGSPATQARQPAPEEIVAIAKHHLGRVLWRVSVAKKEHNRSLRYSRVVCTVYRRRTLWRQLSPVRP